MIVYLEVSCVWCFGKVGQMDPLLQAIVCVVRARSWFALLPVRIGLNQGSPLSPVLVIIFMDSTQNLNKKTLEVIYLTFNEYRM